MDFNEKKLLDYEKLEPENSNDVTEAGSLPFYRVKNDYSQFGRDPPDFFSRIWTICWRNGISKGGTKDSFLSQKFKS